jgi:gamma-glutamyltranspeptidase/glutathione hydrolase
MVQVNKRSMIVTPQPEASEAGVEILRAGGNAVDAAIASALVQGVVDPLMCGVAGFGSMAIYLPERNHHGYIDFHSPAPSAARPDMWEALIESETRDGYGFVLKGRVNDIGYRSVCVPASLKAYHEAQTEFGALSWEQVVQPAIAWAERGWFVRPHVHWFWTQEDQMGRAPNPERLRFSASGRRMFCRADGSPKRVGDRVHNPDLANTLRLVARHGVDIFYKGEIAARIAEDMRRNGGLVSRDDLAGYRPVRSEPLWGTFRDFAISSNQPPGGGLLLIEMLNILENFDLRSLEHNSSDYISVVAEAMKRATRDKDAHVGDPRFVSVPMEALLSKDYARKMSDEIRRGIRCEVPRFEGGLPSKDTTHLCVVDAHGGCVSMTHSLGMPSGVITEGLGFMYNGCMGVFDPRPGHAGSIAPGKARFSSICPSIVFKDSRPFLVIGAPGATQIAMGVLQATLNVLDFGMTMTEAVSAPRFSATSNAIDVSNRISFRATDALAAQGYEIVRSPYGFGFAAVHGIKVARDGLDGAADPGHDGVAMAV